MSLHNTMLPHGPDATAFEHASNAELKPVKLTNTLAFMFETRFRQRASKLAAELPSLQSDYIEPPRDCRRPQLLRGRVYDEQDDEQVCTGGS